MKNFIILFLVFITNVAFSQSVNPKIQVQVSFNNELLRNNGFRAGGAYFLSNKQKQLGNPRKLRYFNFGIGANISSYTQKNYANNFIYVIDSKFQFARQVKFKNGFVWNRFFEIHPGIGLHQAFLKGNVFETNENGFENAKKTNVTGLAPSLGFSMGSNVSKILPNLQTQLGVDVSQEFSSTKYGIPAITASAGLRYTIK